MSLVNDVLRDLDARQGGTAAVAGVAVTPAAQSGKSRRLIPLALFVGAAVCLALWLASSAPESPQPQGTVTAPQSPRVIGTSTMAEAQAAGADLPTQQPQLNAASLGISSSLTLMQPRLATAEQTPTPAPTPAETSTSTASRVVPGRISFGESKPRVAQTSQATPQELASGVAERVAPPVTLADSPISVESVAPEAAPERNPDDTALSRERQARNLIAASDYAGAADLLAAEPMPPLATHTRYYALVAAAQTSARQSKAAAKTYRALLATDPSNGSWWLGLGAALEADGHTAAASDALRRALASQNITPVLRHQAAMRLQRIGQATGGAS